MSRYCHLVYENKRKGEGALRDLTKGPPIHPKMLEIGQNDQNLIILTIFCFLFKCSAYVSLVVSLVVV